MKGWGDRGLIPTNMTDRGGSEQGSAGDTNDSGQPIIFNESSSWQTLGRQSESRSHRRRRGCLGFPENENGTPVASLGIPKVNLM